MVKEQEEGRRPINRPYTWRQQERREGKWRKKNTWFKGGKEEFTSVMFCPHTPGGEVAKRWREVEERVAASRGWRFRIVELGAEKYPPPYVVTRGEDPVERKTAWSAPLEAGGPVDGLAAHMT